VLINNGSFKGFTENERTALRHYLNNGGILFAEDCSGQKFSRFDSAIRKEFSLIYPDKKLFKVEQSNAVYRAFYLLRNVSGRVIVNNYIEGMDIGGRTAVLYSQNDLFGSWARDKFGNYFYDCSPGGDSQRFDAQKLLINIVMYSVTGTYKSDTIHRPFIERKLH
jgi:hypothetical protein